MPWFKKGEMKDVVKLVSEGDSGNLFWLREPVLVSDEVFHLDGVPLPLLLTQKWLGYMQRRGQWGNPVLTISCLEWWLRLSVLLQGTDVCPFFGHYIMELCRTTVIYNVLLSDFSPIALRKKGFYGYVWHMPRNCSLFHSGARCSCDHLEFVTS